jgi:hypothetical protein
VARDGQPLDDRPEVLLRCHPADAVEAGQRQRPGVRAEGAVPVPVEVVLEVAHDELADGPVDRSAEAQAGELGRRDRAPETAFAIDREDVIVVVVRLEVDEQRRLPVDPERRRCQERAFGAVRGAVTHHAARRAHGVAVGLHVVRQIIEIALHLLGRREATKQACLRAREPIHHASV